MLACGASFIPVLLLAAERADVDSIPTTVEASTHLLTEHRFGGVPVLSDGLLMGIITLADVIWGLAREK